MNYIKIYQALIDRAKHRTLCEYTERHHIVPKCLGGDDESTNLVDLTPEEHYVAHQLLAKIYPEHHELVIAARMMTVGRPSNKLYGWLRKRHRTAMSIAQTGKLNSQYGTRWIHDSTSNAKKIRKDAALPFGWFEGRVSRTPDVCCFCKIHPSRTSSKFCSDKCMTYNKSHAIYIIDTHLEEMLVQFSKNNSITKTLHLFGIEGRRGNSYFSSILKERGFVVLKRRNSKPY